MKKITFLVIALFVSTLLSGQMLIVKGKVTGFKKYPLQNIVVKGSKSNSKVVTNESGVFEIVCFPDETLIFESQSFVKVKHKIVDPKDSVNVNLVFKASKKSREYAIANGVIKEEDLTYAISNLKNENNNFDTYSNIYDLIIGRFAGVEVRGTSIIIRGQKSLMADNSALLVVDGMVVQDISFINPNDVKSIDVLKDASSAMYGSRGANGVVIITMKRQDY